MMEAELARGRERENLEAMRCQNCSGRPIPCHVQQVAKLTVLKIDAYGKYSGRTFVASFINNLNIKPTDFNSTP
jgi:hypothetical protein